MISINKKKLMLGASLVEYGLLVSLVAVVALLALQNMGRATLCKNCYVNFAMRARCGQSTSSACMGGWNYQNLWVNGCIYGSRAHLIYRICSTTGGGTAWTWQ